MSFQWRWHGLKSKDITCCCRFASIAKLAGERLKPYIAALVPKLYRYQYDPNARVRDSMVHIWRALIDNPKKTVDENFDAIATELLKVRCMPAGWTFHSVGQIACCMPCSDCAPP